MISPGAERLLAALLLVAASAPASARPLDDLVSAIAGRGEHRVAFSEERHNQLLATPLVAEGYLEYFPETGELVKVIVHPEPAVMRVTDDAIVVERADRRRRIALRKRPELSAMFAGMRGLIQGDAAIIERYFEHELQRNGDGWRLVLQPRAERMRRRVDRLIIEGRGNRLLSICTRLDADEWHFMTFPGYGAGSEAR